MALPSDTTVDLTKTVTTPNASDNTEKGIWALDDDEQQEELKEETEEEQEDDEEEQSEDGKKEKTKGKEKDEEKEEKEIKLSDEDEEPLEDVELVVPVSWKKIAQKYPELAKEFPALKNEYFAAQKYKEVFPTVEDAESAKERSAILDGFESKLLTGDTSDILSVVKANDQEAFNKVVDNYLPNLAKVDVNAFNHIIGNVMKNTIRSMAEEARSSQNEDLQKAALILNQFVFGTSQYNPPTNLSKSNTNNSNENEENSRLKAERAQFEKQRFDTASEDLTGRIQNTLRSTINDHIDPRNSMTAYVKKHAINEAMAAVDEAMSNDTAFRSTLDNLWRTAFKQNFSKESLGRIRSAYLSKAKTVLPGIISKARREALNSSAPKNDNEEERKNKKGPLPVSQPRQTSGKSKTEVPKGMKTIDFLMQD